MFLAFSAFSNSQAPIGRREQATDSRNVYASAAGTSMDKVTVRTTVVVNVRIALIGAAPKGDEGRLVALTRVAVPRAGRVVGTAPLVVALRAAMRIAAAIVLDAHDRDLVASGGWPAHGRTMEIARAERALERC
jgi:hypothetical protein